MRNKMKKGLVLTILLLNAAVLFAGGRREAAELGSNAVEGDAKYVFLFIGDGMALPQIAAAEAYLTAKAGTGADQILLNFSSFPAQGMTTTYAYDRFITGSAAAASAIATGVKTSVGVISMDPAKSRCEKTIAEMAHESGYKIGIVSSVDLDHATPAAFYAHQPSRSMYYEIGLEAVASDVDYFGGGTFRISKTPEGAKTVHELMEESGWTIAASREEMAAIRPGTAKVYSYNKGFAGEALPYDIDREADDVSLAEYTRKGIELLDNEDGFFMMVESGKIDWACHANDAASAIQDTLAFAEAVDEAIEFYNAHPDETLIIVTGDHETGGLSLGFAGTGYESSYEKIGEQTVSYEYFDKKILKGYLEDGTGDLKGLMEEIETCFGLTALNDYEMELLRKAFARTVEGDEHISNEIEDRLLYGGYTPLTMQLTHLQNNRSGLAWTSYKHTAVPVASFARGVGQEMFHGYYDNTEIFSKIKAAMGL